MNKMLLPRSVSGILEKNCATMKNMLFDHSLRYQIVNVIEGKSDNGGDIIICSNSMYKIQ